MSETALICGNWGNTNLRAFCVSKEGIQTSPTRHERGIAQLSKRDQAGIWRSLVSDWHAENPSTPQLICGAAGSNLGWLETGYVTTPAGLDDVRAAITWHDTPAGKVGIVPGISTRSFLGEFDTMRSEETEIFGWLEGNPGVQDAVFCLPGTHTKWVRIERRRIAHVFTGYVGELFASLRATSILTRGADEVALGGDFDAGVDLALKAAPGTLLHRLMSVRTRQLSGELSAAGSASYLSGLLVASDVAGALEILGHGPAPIQVIGSGAAGQSYARVLSHLGQAHSVHDSDAACARGLAVLGQLVAAT